MSKGLVSGNAQNSAGGNSPRNRSKFNLSYQFYDTHRFGEYHPFFVMDTVDTDRVGARCQHDVRSYTLKAPLMQDIKMKKDYFSVPWMAILPLNWEKFYTNPPIGDDVPDDVGCGVKSFWSVYSNFINALITSYNSYLAGSSGQTSIRDILSLIRLCVLGEYVYSNGNLMSSLGIHGAPFCKVTRTGVNSILCWDDFFDAAMTFLKSSGVLGFTIVPQVGSGIVSDWDSSYYVDLTDSYSLPSTITYGSPSETTKVINLRQALTIFRDEPSYCISRVNLGTLSAASLTTALAGFMSEWTFTFTSPGTEEQRLPLNIGRLWAYQLVCSHFYSNDHVDYIYSANLFREVIGYYYDLIAQANSSDSFDPNSPYYGFVVNGVKYTYDNLSAHIFNNIVSFLVWNPSSVLYSVSTEVTRTAGLPYLAALLSYNRSLRFLDYFTGARTRPLAVGDVNVDVNSSGGSSSVSVIDVTRNIQKQRFLNAVNRAGRKMSGYMSELFGKAPAHDWHDPMYLGHTADVIFGSEVENTGAAQLTDANSVTSVLRSNASRYGFEFECDRDSIVLGLCYYDLSRNYSRSIERQNFMVNRFDYFNPFMQFVGDQPIYRGELGSLNDQPSNLVPFAYTNRDMQWKQRYNQCAGGFVKALPGWLFKADDNVNGDVTKLSPSYIRSNPCELDPFYVSLSGFSLGTYFHFIVRSTNEVTASRPMAYAPSIL